MLNDAPTEKNLHAHMASLSEFPGDLSETINNGTLEIRVLGGQLAIASFDSEVRMDGNLIMTGHNAVTFHKVKANNGGPEEWKVTVIADQLSAVTPSS